MLMTRFSSLSCPVPFLTLFNPSPKLIINRFPVLIEPILSMPGLYSPPPSPIVTGTGTPASLLPAPVLQLEHLIN